MQGKDGGYIQKEKKRPQRRFMDVAKEDVQRVGVAKEDAEEEEKEEGMFGITYRGSIKTSPKYLTMISIVVFCFVYCCIHDFLFY